MVLLVPSAAVVASVEQDGDSVTVTTADGANYTAPFAVGGLRALNVSSRAPPVAMQRHAAPCSVDRQG